MKIIHIVGARPQFIKYFPVSNAVQAINGSSGNSITELLIHTGQHYDYSMSKVFFDEFGIKEPDYHLGVGSGLHGEQTGRIIEKVEGILNREKPDAVLVYGDTNSSLGGALGAVKLQIPVAHIEAGLRSFNKYMPEEINRIIIDHASTILFCPSETAVKNLKAEGFKNIINEGALISTVFFTSDKKAEKIIADKNNPIVVNVGDVMRDVLLYAVAIAEKRSKIIEELRLSKKGYCTLTLHRAENTDHPEQFEDIVDFVNEVCTGKSVIFPMHPRTRKVYGNISKKFSSNVTIIDPISYFDMLHLLKNSALLLTDSGGMQKEAYWLRIPCITLRNETEWLETLRSGWNVLYKNYRGEHKVSESDKGYFGDGKSAERIITTIINTLG